MRRLGRFAVGKVFEVVADRIVQMARNALRLVDEVDQVRVGHLGWQGNRRMDDSWSCTVVEGKDLVKVDSRADPHGLTGPGSTINKALPCSQTAS